VPSPSAAKSHWLITGRGFRALTPKPTREMEVAPSSTQGDPGTSSATKGEPPAPEEPSGLAEPGLMEAEPAPLFAAVVDHGEALAEMSVPIETVDEAPDAETA